MREKLRRCRREGSRLYVLGIESSCDETAASVLCFEGDGPGGVSAGRKPGDKGLCPRVLSDVVARQEDIHKKFGGVVPELASRRHVEMIEPVFRAALEDASVSLDEIGALAVTRGPGLVTALLVGLSAAKGIAWSMGLPLVGVHHLNGHIHSLFLDPNGSAAGSGAVGGPPPFPHLAFVVSRRPHRFLPRRGIRRGPPLGGDARRCRGRGIRQSRRGDGPWLSRRDGDRRAARLVSGGGWLGCRGGFLSPATYQESSL